jgi:hypothetical protein
MTGNATAKANTQAFNQMLRILDTSPTLKTLITNDIMHDMSNAMKNENTYF